jgi:hypothetical protein
VTKHDPTDEAETLPGIPIAGSDLEGFPSVAPIIGGGGLSLNVRVQHGFLNVTGTPTSKDTATISAVVVARSYVIVQGSVQPPGASGSRSWTGITFSMIWELTNPTTVSMWRNSSGPNQRVNFAVIEYL